MKKRSLLSLLAAALLAGSSPALAQTTVKKVVLQGFWWDYTNNSFRNKWADYLVELAPRLKELGIDAVWIPPTPKNNGGTNAVGYAPFDAYDLGDKFQKGTTTTRVGTKDELLRLIAVLHANGIEVVQDVVLNHVDGAGTANGAGGLDPDSYSMSANGGYKSFRNASFATPVPESGDNAAAYLLRSGRWPKNFSNFHAHWGHNTTSGDYAAPYFGPDFCYGDDGGSDGYGGLSSAVLTQYPNAYNPAQAANYSRNQARQWLLWMKKQTGVDGIRWDAVKNYAYAPQQDWTYNLKYLNGFANGGESMLSTGEFVGSKQELDAYVLAMNARNGGSEFATGTFDFSLRGAIYGMVSGGGNYDLGQIPGAQQDQRVAYYAGSNTYVHRTAPFVNSHDTFRPILNATGNYTGWNTGSELAAHIEPNDGRLSAAYAISLAVDGNPHIFIEDLFNIGYTGNRFTHLPADAAALPVRSDLANLIWCHQNLNFKAGAYFVRQQSPDHLVIERGGQALIGINDNWNTWQNATVTTNFAPGTVLQDYSGANGTATRTVGAGGVVSIGTPPCDGTAAQGRRGYSVWAPVGQGGSAYTPGRAARTTQEWELADDLGDSSCGGLGQGGALPGNSVTARTAGKIFVRAGRSVDYVLYPEDNNTNTRPLTISLYDAQGQRVSSATGTRSIAGAYTPTADGWLTLRVANANATQTGQRAYAQVSYEAPLALNTRLSSNNPRATVAVWTAAAGTTDVTNCRNWAENLLPAPVTDVRIPAGVSPQPVVASGYFFANQLTVEAGASLTVQRGAVTQLFGDLVSEGTLAGNGTWIFSGINRNGQYLRSPAPLSFSKLELRNDSSDVILGTPVTVRDTLNLRKGRLEIGNFNLNLNTADVLNASTISYVLTRDHPAVGGAVQRPLRNNTSVLFPVGTVSGYSPISLNSGTDMTMEVRVFNNIFADGNGGALYPQASNFVNRTWALVGGPSVGGFPGTADIQWNATDENPNFQRFQSALFMHSGTNGWGRRSTAAVTAAGNGPYVAAVNNVTFGRYLAVGNFGPLATRSVAEPALLNVYPNPTAGQVQLTNVAGFGKLRLQLSNALGQPVGAPLAGNAAQLEAGLNALLDNAATGLYLLTVQADGRTQHLRLVRE